MQAGEAKGGNVCKLVHGRERVRLWRELDHPKRDAFPGDPREWEKHNATPANLSDLGAKLLGVTPWF